MTLTEIIVEGLRRNGYDGLFCEDGCACKLDDLVPCGNLSESCYPGVLIDIECCGNCTHSQPCDFHMGHKPSK